MNIFSSYRAHKAHLFKLKEGPEITTSLPFKM